MTICSAVLIQYQRVTDGRTDRRQAYSYYVRQHADARKNGEHFVTSRRCVLFDFNQILHDGRGGQCDHFIAHRFLRALAMLKHVIDIGWTSVRPFVCPSVCQ